MNNGGWPWVKRVDSACLISEFPRGALLRIKLARPSKCLACLCKSGFGDLRHSLYFHMSGMHCLPGNKPVTQKTQPYRYFDKNAGQNASKKQLLWESAYCNKCILSHFKFFLKLHYGYCHKKPERCFSFLLNRKSLRYGKISNIFHRC